MSEWKARRFWKAAAVRQADGGFEVLLDGRPVRTPGKHALLLPARALADAIAQEWDAQDDVINPNSMPLTRAANSAIEKVTPKFAEVADMLTAYGGTDLLCYRADAPEDLVRLQAEGWDPVIDWAATQLNAPLRITHGVIPVEQPSASLARLRARVHALEPFGLTALHDLVTLPGSLLLGLAVIEGRLGADEAFHLSRIDERFQAARWGEDNEAQQAAEYRRSAMLLAARFRELSRLYLT
ncbi:ATP12 family chaperone protein [Paracoccus sp. (in: a-proteobacteria)]|uniref:ATP12 family chaperone protein n=1 Tax=Paracoccus sp. TaxID=267 RepID=UPI003A85B0CC